MQPLTRRFLASAHRFHRASVGLGRSALLLLDRSANELCELLSFRCGHSACQPAARRCANLEPATPEEDDVALPKVHRENVAKGDRRAQVRSTHGEATFVKLDRFARPC